jgi:hypothetical protein
MAKTALGEIALGEELLYSKIKCLSEKKGNLQETLSLKRLM